MDRAAKAVVAAMRRRPRDRGPKWMASLVLAVRFLTIVPFWTRGRGAGCARACCVVVFCYRAALGGGLTLADRVLSAVV